MATRVKRTSRSFATWWKNMRRRKRISAVAYLKSTAEIPKGKIGGKLFIVRRAGLPRWAVLDCPCRCGRRIQVNLMRSHRPRWILKEEGSHVSLTPSLWQPELTCGSHFFITRNRIEWID